MSTDNDLINNPVLLNPVVENLVISCQEKPLPFVWNMDYGGVVHTLVGTKHNAPRHYDAAIGTALEGIEQVLLELDMSKGKSPETIAFQEYLRHELAKRLSPEETILLLPIIEAYTGTEGIDAVVDTTARTRGIPVFELETQAEQIACMRGLVDAGLHCIDAIPVFVRKYFLNKELQKKALDTIAKQQEEYDAGDNTSFLKFCQTFSDRLPEVYDRMVVQRNKTLVERSLPYLTKPTLVAVGVGHFLANLTMLALYEQQGARITRVERKQH